MTAHVPYVFADDRKVRRGATSRDTRCQSGNVRISTVYFLDGDADKTWREKALFHRRMLFMLVTWLLVLDAGKVEVVVLLITVCAAPRT